MDERTLPILSLFPLYRALASNLSLGIGDHASLADAQRSHSLDGLVASPPNLQLIPMMAIGAEGVWPALVWESPFR